MTDEIVTVATFQSLTEAEACKLHLESEGLTVFLTDEDAVKPDRFLSKPNGSIKIQVPSAQIENATALLEQVRQRHEVQSKHTDEDFCLACGVIMPKDSSQCQACGWTYADGDHKITDHEDD